MSGVSCGTYLIDTTLRDGLQGCGRGLPHTRAVQIAHALFEAGVGEIEAGIAMRSADRERIRRLRTVIPASRLSVWCRLRREDLDTARSCGVDIVHLSLPGSSRLLAAFGMDRRWRDGALERLLPQACGSFRRVSLGIQDAAGTEPEDLLELLQVARRHGVARLRLADSAGRWLPNQAAQCVSQLLPHCGSVELGVHAHDDLGLATAVSLAALGAGARSCDVTVCGIGERAGNAALEQVALACRVAGIATGIRTQDLHRLAHLTMSTLGRRLAPDQPVVGDSCFAHQSGLHHAAMDRDAGCYEPFPPEDVGAVRSEPVGCHIGRSGLVRALRRLGLPCDGAYVSELLPRVIHAATREGRSLLDNEFRALAESVELPPSTDSRREPWPSTSPLTTSSSATASA